MKPRSYQLRIVQRTIEKIEAGHKSIAVVMPTGTGKSLIIAMITRLLAATPDKHVLMLAHKKELVQQNYEKLLAFWPTAPVGIYSAGLGKKDFRRITYGGIMSVANVEELPTIDILFVDEAHMINDEDEGTYRETIKRLHTLNPSLVVIGLTATPFRLKGGSIVGEGSLFTDIVDAGSKHFQWYVDQGYLSKLVTKQTDAFVNTDNVPLRKGDFDSGALDAATNRDELTAQIVFEAKKMGEGRKHWLVFGCSIDHVEKITNFLNIVGISARCVHSKMDKKERDKNISDHKKGLFVALVNNDILTTGYDNEAIDLLLFIRATKSMGLWQQMLGRGTRILPHVNKYETATERLKAIAESDKPDCLVLDFARNTERLGGINEVPEEKGEKGSEKGKEPVKACPNCRTYVHPKVAKCPECGHTFEFKANLVVSAATGSLISLAKKTKFKRILKLKVISCYPKKFVSLSGEQIVKMVYVTEDGRANQTLTFNKDSPFYERNVKWWRLCVNKPIPNEGDDIFEAVQNLYQTPKEIQVERVNAKQIRFIGMVL